MEGNGQTCSCATQLDSGATQGAFRVGAGRGEVCHMHEVVAARNITKCGGIREFYRVPEKFVIGGRRAIMRSRLETVAIIGPQYAKLGFTQSYGLFEYRIERRNEITGRRADDAQNLDRRGLPFASCRQLYLKRVDTSLHLGKGRARRIFRPLPNRPSRALLHIPRLRPPDADYPFLLYDRPGRI